MPSSSSSHHIWCPGQSKAPSSCSVSSTCSLQPSATCTSPKRRGYLLSWCRRSLQAKLRRRGRLGILVLETDVRSGCVAGVVVPGRETSSACCFLSDPLREFGWPQSHIGPEAWLLTVGAGNKSR